MGQSDAYMVVCTSVCFLLDAALASKKEGVPDCGRCSSAFWVIAVAISMRRSNV